MTTLRSISGSARVIEADSCSSRFIPSRITRSSWRSSSSRTLFSSWSSARLVALMERASKLFYAQKRTTQTNCMLDNFIILLFDLQFNNTRPWTADVEFYLVWLIFVQGHWKGRICIAIGGRTQQVQLSNVSDLECLKNWLNFHTIFHWEIKFVFGQFR